MRTPDTITTVHVYLTDEEIGKAFVNRTDQEQVNILKWVTRGFDNSVDAQMQAMYIGKKMFAQAGETATKDAINFLRCILDAIAEESAAVSKLASARPTDDVA